MMKWSSLLLNLLCHVQYSSSGFFLIGVSIVSFPILLLISFEVGFLLDSIELSTIFISNLFFLTGTARLFALCDKLSCMFYVPRLFFIIYLFI